MFCITQNMIIERRDKQMSEIMMKWAKEHGLEDLYKQYLEEVKEIEEECYEEGFPSNGDTFDLRVEALKRSYPELWGDEEEQS